MVFSDIRKSGRWKDADGDVSSTPDGDEFGGVTDFGWVVQGKFGPEYVKDEITGKRIYSAERIGRPNCRVVVWRLRHV